MYRPWGWKFTIQEDMNDASTNIEEQSKTTANK